MSKGEAAPQPARIAAMVVGMSWSEAVFAITSIHISSDAYFEPFIRCSPRAARMPAGVAALPKPRRFAEILAHISPMMSLWFFAAGNIKPTAGRIKRASFSISPLLRITSIMPLQNMTIPPMDRHSSHAAAAPSITEAASCSIRPLTAAQTRETSIIPVQSFPIIRQNLPFFVIV